MSSRCPPAPLVLAVLLAGCGDDARPVPRTAIPLPPPVPPSAAKATPVAPIAPPSRKAGPSLFVGHQQTWVVLASGRVVSWGEEGNRRDPPNDRPRLVAKSKDVVGIRLGIERASRDYEDQECEMKEAGQCPAQGPPPTHERLVGAKLVDVDPSGTACGVMPDDTLRCYGPIASELTDYEHGPFGAPRDFGKLSDVLELSVGEAHACALRRNGEVLCWGHLGPGLLGNGESAMRERAPVLGIDDAKAISLVEKDGGCAIRRSGHVACWGSNERGQLGVKPSDLPGRATAADLPGVALAEKFVADGHCVVRSDAKLQCWGVVTANDPALVPRADPAPYVVDVADAVDAAYVYQKGLCVVRRGGTVECVGKTKSTLTRSSGAIGIASHTSDVDVLTCVLLTGGRLRCWISEGSESFTRRVPNDSLEVEALAVKRWGRAHEAFQVVRTASGAIAMGKGDGRADWESPLAKPSPRGLIASGQLEITAQNVARMARGTAGYVVAQKDGHVIVDGDEVEGVTDAVDIANNGVGTCIVRRGGTVECWGEERGASFGRGKPAYSATPVHVTLPEPPLL
ncbi:MAG TPA: hypothetical protein PK141_07350 [Polyangiaceae bacterium]|nr:hypothetical protein [Polyangiaceae bacterium]